MGLGGLGGARVGVVVIGVRERDCGGGEGTQWATLAGGEHLKERRQASGRWAAEKGAARAPDPTPYSDTAAVQVGKGRRLKV